MMVEAENPSSKREVCIANFLTEPKVKENLQEITSKGGLFYFWLQNAEPTGQRSEKLYLLNNKAHQTQKHNQFPHLP